MGTDCAFYNFRAPCLIVCLLNRISKLLKTITVQYYLLPSSSPCHCKSLSASHFTMPPSMPVQFTLASEVLLNSCLTLCTNVLMLSTITTFCIHARCTIVPCFTHDRSFSLQYWSICYDLQNATTLLSLQRSTVLDVLPALWSSNGKSDEHHASLSSSQSVLCHHMTGK